MDLFNHTEPLKKKNKTRCLPQRRRGRKENQEKNGQDYRMEEAFLEVVIYNREKPTATKL